ncbi:MAG: hypothetical protein R3D32_15560 [Nitratireductor sp.]
MRGFVGAGVGTGFLGDETIQTNLIGSATAFATQVQGVNDTFARLSAGFTAEIQAGLKFSTTYTGTFGEDREQHTLGGKLIASF